MYGGPRRTPPPFYQAQFRPPPQNFRPQFANPGFPPPHQNFPPQFTDYRHPGPSYDQARPFGNPRFRGARGGFQPRAWHAHGVRQGFRPSGSRGQRGGGAHRDSLGIEAYYKHSMVENPWKELEEKYKEKNQES